ncbi:LacI family DNA-binding transcriptional regulator [Sphingomonas oryzagri]
MSNPIKPTQSRPATIRDVSRVAGVSIKTVSRVINNQKYVGAETRHRVEEAMAELQFHPNSAARALAGHRTRQIALICDNPNPWYVYEVQYGTRQRCRDDGVRMIAQPYDRNAPDLVSDVASLIEQVHPDGLILTPPASDHRALLDELIRRRLPFVRIQPGNQLDLSPSVFVDNEIAAFDMTTHLLTLGHRRIGFIIGDRDYAASGQRMNGYVRALSERGIGLDLALVRQGNFGFGSGAAAAEELLREQDRPTAIFASSDDMAAGALAVAHRLGIKVPDELSIAGFDDTDFAAVVWPALTTVRQPIRALAEAAAELLLSPGSAGTRRNLRHELVIRDSVAPPSDI